MNRNVLAVLGAICLCCLVGTSWGQTSEDEVDQRGLPNDPPFYWAEEIRGQVVDAVTGDPLAGAVVVVRWNLFGVGFGHGSTVGAIHLIEVLTDDQGNYVVPAWGPRLRPPSTFMRNNEPRLRFFKRGYFPQSHANKVLGNVHRTRDAVRKSEWNGKVIKLQPFDGSDWAKYSDHLDSLWSSFGDCLRECPQLVLGLDEESKTIKSLSGLRPGSRLNIDIENFDEGDKTFLKALRK